MSEESNIDQLMVFNGVDASTGDYDRPPMSREELWTVIKGEADPENLDELRFRYQRSKTTHFGVKEGVDPKKLEESGWGVIFASDADPELKEALSELLTWREKQAGEYYRLYDGPEGHQKGESKTKFLARHGAGPGPADPEKVPYYLLIVGSPDRIPYRFQSQLDVQYAVGRIHFDTIQEYANYAASVVKAESGQVKLPRTANFFGVANQDDQATQLSAKYLVQPLFDKFKKDHKDWEFTAFMKDRATRKQLSAILGGDKTPSFLFTASHGASFPMGSNLQRAGNGALITQDWPGPKQWKGGQLPEQHYFAGDHLASDRNLLGLIAFFFACYGGGTPKVDEFSAQAFRDSRRQIAPNNFLAHLPNKMLSQPKGGALAVIGHVERAWGYSFVWPKAGRQTAVFESTIQRLLEGHPVGSAIEYFNERYAELSTVLSDELEEIKLGGKRENPYELAGMWTANNDARGYAIIGDPAVRLPVVDEGEESSQRPVIAVEYKAPAAEESAEPESPETPERTGAVQADSTEAENSSTTTTEPAGDGAASPFYVDSETVDKYPEEYKKLYQNWIDYVDQGYTNNDEVFRRILNTMLSDHNTTVAMYVILFTVGIGLFVIAAILAVTADDTALQVAALFGGLGVVAFINYFIGRSVRSVEENLEFITWLGLIYNTYWTRLAWTFKDGESQKVVKETTEIAIQQLEHLINVHGIARDKRYKLKEKDGGDDAGGDDADVNTSGG